LGFFLDAHWQRGSGQLRLGTDGWRFVLDAAPVNLLGNSYMEALANKSIQA